MQISFVSFENENSQGNENVILGGQREHVVLWYSGTLQREHVGGQRSDQKCDGGGNSRLGQSRFFSIFNWTFNQFLLLFLSFKMCKILGQKFIAKMEI